MHLHPTLREHRIEAAAHACVVRGQDGVAAGQQVKRQFIGVATKLRQLIAQAKLHGQQQLHATCACAHHSNSGFA